MLYNNENALKQNVIMSLKNDHKIVLTITEYTKIRT